MNWPLPIQRAACWLTADRCFDIVVVCCAPLFTICLIGLWGAP